MSRKTTFDKDPWGSVDALMYILLMLGLESTKLRPSSITSYVERMGKV